MNTTAVILSSRSFKVDFTSVVHTSIIKTPDDLCRARWDAVRKVRTPYFFYLDDDDTLPENFLSVLEECEEKIKGNGVVYTDEMVNGVLSAKAAYSQQGHLENPTLVHHLAVCDTELALRAIDKLPVGDYAPEPLLYWELAKSGAIYVPRVGYHWNRKASGMSHWPKTVVSQMRSVLYNRAQCQ